MRIREVYKDYDRFKSRSKKLNKWVRENFTDEKQYKKVVDVVMESLGTNEEEIDELNNWLNSLETEIIEHN